MQLSEPPETLLDGASLFLDFDGTLVELAETPDAIEVGEELLQLLSKLQARLEGRIVLISGRALDDIARLVRPLALPIAGSHGLEVRTPGLEASVPQRPQGLDRIVRQMKELENRHPGVHIEEKPAGVAVHYRLAPGAQSACHEAAARAAMEAGLALQPGKMLIELKPMGADKGQALAAFMREAAFAGTRPVFLGDDLTDEDGFKAARELGGAGVLIGELRPTAAAYRLRDVVAVRSWLEQACEALA